MLSLAINKNITFHFSVRLAFDKLKASGTSKYLERENVSDCDERFSKDL